MTENEKIFIENAVLRKSAPIPLKRAFYDATMGPFTHTQICTISLTDKDGFTGEAPFVVREGFSLYETVVLPVLFQNYGCPYGEVMKKLYWQMRNFGFRDSAASSLSSLDLALHDISAQKMNLPFHRMMGGEQDSCRVYGSGGGVNLTENELLAEVEKLAEISCGIVKIKIQPGDGLKAAIKRVKSVIGHIGETALAVDVNQALDYKEAVEFSLMLKDSGAVWFEEPVHSADLEALQKVCADSPVSIALGESERSGKTFKYYYNLGVTHFQPQVHKLASVGEWMGVRDLAAEKQLTLSSGGIAPLAAQMIATSNTGQSYCEFLLPIMEDYAGFMKTPPVMDSGEYRLVHKNGLGMNIDWEKVNKTGYAGDVQALDREGFD